MAIAVTAAQAASADLYSELWQQRYWKRIVAKRLAEFKRAERRRRQKEVLPTARPVAAKPIQPAEDSMSEVVSQVSMQDPHIIEAHMQSTRGKLFEEGAGSFICPTSMDGNEGTGHGLSSLLSTDSSQFVSSAMVGPRSALPANGSLIDHDSRDIGTC